MNLYVQPPFFRRIQKLQGKFDVQIYLSSHYSSLVAFDVYDLDNDGYISNGELFLVLKVMSGDHLKPLELQQVVDKTIRDCDTDGDGKISFDEFRSMVERKNADFFALWNFNDL